MDLDKWYKEQVKSNLDDPPEALWGSIQDELDMDRVWFRLENSLARARKFPFWAYKAVAASVALLIGFSGLYFWFDQQDIMSDGPKAIVRQEQPGNAAEAVSTEDSSENILISPDRMSRVIESLPSERILLADLSPSETTELEMPEQARLKGIDPVKDVNIVSPGQHSASLRNNQRNLEEEILSSLKPEPLQNRFSIGILGQFANTWLLSPKTFQGLESYELTATNASFGKNLGLSFMKPLSGRTNLKADLMFLSQSRQNYKEYVSGIYTSTSLQLDYTSLSLMMGFSPGSVSSPHSIQLGVYAGTLIQARQLTGEDNLVVRDEYSNSDFGLIGGYEYYFPVSENVFLGTGFFAKFGLTNAFSGNQQIPDDLNRTHNAAFIFSLSVNYSVK